MAKKPLYERNVVGYFSKRRTDILHWEKTIQTKLSLFKHHLEIIADFLLWKKNLQIEYKSIDYIGSDMLGTAAIRHHDKKADERILLTSQIWPFDPLTPALEKAVQENKLELTFKKETTIYL